MNPRAARAVLLTIWLLMFLCVGALGMLMARSEENPGYWWQLQAVRACCSDADAVYADDWQIMPDGSVRATVTGGGPRNHAWAPIGKTYEVPADKILREPGNPTGRPLLFIRMGDLHLYCFALGAGI